MKKALTLIELIFTIVIIAAVFTTIPKIIYVSNKSLEFSKKEDSIFNMMSKIMDVSLKEYDEKNTEYDDILLTGQTPPLYLDCNSSNGYRKGGFSGSRNCLNRIEESSIPSNSDGEYDYIEGYNGYTDTLKSGHTTYTLNINVGYTDEWGKSDYSSQSLDYTFTQTSGTDKKNIKRINVKILDSSGNVISSISYYSANIGHIKINSVQW